MQVFYARLYIERISKPTEIETMERKNGKREMHILKQWFCLHTENDLITKKARMSRRIWKDEEMSAEVVIITSTGWVDF